MKLLTQTNSEVVPHLRCVSLQTIALCGGAVHRGVVESDHAWQEVVSELGQLVQLGLFLWRQSKCFPWVSYFMNVAKTSCNIFTGMVFICTADVIFKSWCDNHKLDTFDLKYAAKIM